jgi:hypothetical protein
MTAEVILDLGQDPRDAKIGYSTLRALVALRNADGPRVQGGPDPYTRALLAARAEVQRDLDILARENARGQR